MKHLIIIIFSISAFFSVVTNGATPIDIPIEMDGFKIEFFETSNRGIISVIGCDSCDEKIYEFKSSIDIFKQGKKISLNVFLKDYWNSDNPTIFLDPKSGYAIRIIY
jgi:hypothetical protein